MILVARDDDDARQHGQRDLVERHGQSQCDNYRGRDACNHASAPAWRLRNVVELAPPGLPPIKPRRNVTDTLGHQFPTRLMPPTGGGVGLQEVSSVTAAHSKAIVKAAGITSGINTGQVSAGKPRGISPITGAPVNQIIPAALPANKATNWPGAYLASRVGQKTPTATVIPAIARASKSTVALVQAFDAAGNTTRGWGRPMAGRTWVTTRTMPAAVKNPDSSEWGM